MIERSITQYLANHDRRRGAAPPASVWAPSGSGSALSGRPMLDMAGLEFEDAATDMAESEGEAQVESRFVPLADDMPQPTFEPYPPEHKGAESPQVHELVEAEINAAREAWVHTESAVLHERITSAFAEMERSIADQVARSLQPFVQDAMRQLVLEALVHRMDAVLSGENGPVLRVSGPQDLLAAVQDHLKDQAAAVICVVAPIPEVQVIAGSLMMETSLSEWVNALRAATGAERADILAPDEDH